MKKIFAYGLLLMVTLAWGVSFVSSKIVLNVIDPISLGFVRYLFAFGFLLIFFFAKKETIVIQKRDIFRLMVSAIIGVALYFYAENTAVSYISASTASILVSTLPIFLILTNFILFRERISRIKMIAVAGSILGVGFVVGGGIDQLTWESIQGYLFMLLAVGAWIVFSLTTMELRKRYSNLKIITLQAGITLLVLAPFAMTAIGPILSMPPVMWAHIAFLGIVCSGLAFYWYVYAMKQIGTVMSSVFINLIPVVTVITGAIVLQEQLHQMQILGGFLIIGAVMFLVWDDMRHLRQAKETFQ